MRRECAGATLHNASRILTVWETAELTTIRRQHVMIRKLAEIRRIAEDLPHWTETVAHAPAKLMPCGKIEQ